MILIEDAYSDEIEALSKYNKIFRQFQENLTKEKEIRLDYETESLNLKRKADFCLNSFLELAKYFGYSYSSIYCLENINYIENLAKIVRIVINAGDEFFLGQKDVNLTYIILNPT